MIEPAVARRIKLVGFDVDGMMTDGGLYIGAAVGQPVELKRFDIQDGLGIHLLQGGGPGRGGRDGAGRRRRAAPGRGAARGRVRRGRRAPGSCPCSRPSSSAGRSAGRKRASSATTCRISRCLRRVALPVAVANACPEVQGRRALHHRGRRAAAGAVREFAEAFLKARGAWTDAGRVPISGSAAMSPHADPRRSRWSGDARCSSRRPARSRRRGRGSTGGSPRR